MIHHEISEKYLYLEALGMGPYSMKKLKVCSQCGTIVGKWRLFCPSCRKRLHRKTLFDEYKTMHTCCPSCDIPLAEDTQYCPHCGKKVNLNTGN